MDEDLVVEPELDAFSVLLPLPYRVALILICGVWGWGVNLHCLSAIHIDVPFLIRYPSSSHPPHHLSVYRLASILTFFLILSLLLFWSVTHGSPSLVLQWEILPQSYLFFLLLFFIFPYRRLSWRGRVRFLSMLKRISVGGLAENQDGKFGDIILADTITSYSKVLGDLFVSGCMLFDAKYESSTMKPDRGCGGQYMTPLIIAIPSAIRLRQCLIEYVRVRRANRNTGMIGSSEWGGQHLANAVKYLSAFPVIVISAMQRDYDVSKLGMTPAGLFNLWILFVFINSLYSFYWDVTNDWGLSILSLNEEIRNSPEYPYGLRRHRYFRSKYIYYIAIAIDFNLRFVWALKLSPHLDYLYNLESSFFLMEILEVLRRWQWIFFRTEMEWIRNNKGPLPDGVLLGDYNGKRDED